MKFEWLLLALGPLGLAVSVLLRAGAPQDAPHRFRRTSFTVLALASLVLGWAIVHPPAFSAKDEEGGFFPWLAAASWVLGILPGILLTTVRRPRGWMVAVIGVALVPAWCVWTIVAFDSFRVWSEAQGDDVQELAANERRPATPEPSDPEKRAAPEPAAEARPSADLPLAATSAPSADAVPVSANTVAVNSKAIVKAVLDVTDVPASVNLLPPSLHASALEKAAAQVSLCNGKHARDERLREYTAAQEEYARGKRPESVFRPIADAWNRTEQAFSTCLRDLAATTVRIPLYATPSASARLPATLAIEVAETALFLFDSDGPEGPVPPTAFDLDDSDSDVFYAHFRHTILKRVGTFVLLPADPFPSPMWIDSAEISAVGAVRELVDGGVFTVRESFGGLERGAGVVVTGVKGGVVSLRTEIASDANCGEDAASGVSEPRRIDVDVGELLDARQHLRLVTKYTRGC